MTTLTPRQRDLVRESFVGLLPRIERVGALFYTHLSQNFPLAYEMLSETEAKTHQNRFFKMLALVVGVLDDEEELRLILLDLGTRHAAYGVQGKHYEKFGEVLLSTLAEAAGPRAFTPEVRAAWKAVYALMMETAQSVYSESNEKSA